jgi:acetylornithine deacetylase/succinyl-diaminopimelate desuccinylase-like protein
MPLAGGRDFGTRLAAIDPRWCESLQDGARPSCRHRGLIPRRRRLRLARLMDQPLAKSLVETVWTESILPQLVEYIRIPNKSPAFDAEWAVHGHMDKAVELIATWAKAQPIRGLSVEVVRLPGRTPLIFMEIPATPGAPADACVMLYGHLDKQPEMVGWEPDLGPWKPVMRGDRLYGRGGADDGYAAFASLTAIRVLQEQKIPHARCVVLIEGCEESGSFDLPPYIDHLASRIGRPSLVVCLDSGCGNYEQLWCTTSLRGMAAGKLTVEVLTEGVHSGQASGIVASSFRIARLLLDRIEDVATGAVSSPSFAAEIPLDRREQAAVAGGVLGDATYSKYPFAGATRAMTTDPAEVILSSTWRPFLAVTGADGLPPIHSAGNVLRPQTSLKLSLRLPPTVSSEEATRALKSILEADPPYGATVRFEPDMAADGWNAPPLAPWLATSMENASRAFFGKGACYIGEGGTIPFMGMLGEKFPDAQFMITGVLGPQSNAHGPNEFLHVPMAKSLTCCVAQVLEDHALQRQ